MKKNFAPLVVLRKLRPGRKVFVLLVYFLMIGLLIAFVAWRNMSPLQLEVPPVVTESEAVTSEGDLEPVTAAPLTPATEDAVAEAVAEEVEEEAPVMTAPTEAMAWPVEGEILIGHHEVYRINNQVRLHVGVDIAVPPDALVAACWPGVVSDVREDSRYGLMLEIEHGGGYISQYANLDDVFFAVGEEVRGGEIVARAGESAGLDASEGLFLHFALYLNGKAIDPVREIGSR
jgi:murein DD-endopeptidase MepM/ murein hydrolase activator NlpD